MSFTSFTPVIKSDEYGLDDYEERETIEEALVVLDSVKAAAKSLNDGIKRTYTIICNLIDSEDE